MRLIPVLKAVLIKNVAQTIPAYTMSCFLLPKTLCLDIERMLNGFWWNSNSSTSKEIRWLAWDKMSMSKMRGGLGYRNLYGFNIAMLRKQIWNFLQKPNSLVARVFKARYYPSGNLLNSARCGGASFLWSGLWTAKEEFKKDFRWVMGDGRNTNVFEDPWLKSKLNFMVERGEYNMSLSTKVPHFLEPHMKKWNVNKVREVFEEIDAQAILKVSIPQHEACDRVAWVHTQEGIYSVKSGYQIWQGRNIQSLQQAQSAGWKKLWNLNIPPKIKFFLWRFCRNNIPVRVLLQRRSNAIPLS